MSFFKRVSVAQTRQQFVCRHDSSSFEMIASDVSTMIKLRKTPPRREIYTLHRRLNGCFQLAARVGATIAARDILLDVYEKHEWGQQQAEAAADPDVLNAE